ncbi:hypothetical protein RFI_09142 [Reticulomyxa filosa]|uniref:Uncharacterized protein n=1 Tax=Reticulomyxa filosa TaxID=46433 RepID=X6NPQ9_RETFI|nr:hypothetical protein RFI_09142 [Reticulomyxa filosa]|eukprot:ETO27991.1 hypothetical protein RFI_09142 [Reticulomyxa filosa]
MYTCMYKKKKKKKVRAETDSKTEREKTSEKDDNRGEPLSPLNDLSDPQGTCAVDATKSFFVQKRTESLPLIQPSPSFDFSLDAERNPSMFCGSCHQELCLACPYMFLLNQVNSISSRNKTNKQTKIMLHRCDNLVCKQWFDSAMVVDWNGSQQQKQVYLCKQCDDALRVQTHHVHEDEHCALLSMSQPYASHNNDNNDNNNKHSDNGVSENLATLSSQMTDDKSRMDLHTQTTTETSNSNVLSKKRRQRTSHQAKSHGAANATNIPFWKKVLNVEHNFQLSPNERYRIRSFCNDDLERLDELDHIMADELMGSDGEPYGRLFLFQKTDTCRVRFHDWRTLACVPLQVRQKGEPSVAASGSVPESSAVDEGKPIAFVMYKRNTTGSWGKIHLLEK